MILDYPLPLPLSHKWARGEERSISLEGVVEAQRSRAFSLQFACVFTAVVFVGIACGFYNLTVINFSRLSLGIGLLKRYP